MKAKREYCNGCRDDWYNHNRGCNETKGCWGLKDGKVVTRYRLGWWTPPTAPGAFEEVKTNSCHHAPGRYAFYAKLPDFVKIEDVRKRRAS